MHDPPLISSLHVFYPKFFSNDWSSKQHIGLAIAFLTLCMGSVLVPAGSWSSSSEDDEEDDPDEEEEEEADLFDFTVVPATHPGPCVSDTTEWLA